MQTVLAPSQNISCAHFLKFHQHRRRPRIPSNVYRSFVDFFWTHSQSLHAVQTQVTVLLVITHLSVKLDPHIQRILWWGVKPQLGLFAGSKLKEESCLIFEQLYSQCCLSNRSCATTDWNQRFVVEILYCILCCGLATKPLVWAQKNVLQALVSGLMIVISKCHQNTVHVELQLSWKRGSDGRRAWFHVWSMKTQQLCWI